MTKERRDIRDDDGADPTERWERWRRVMLALVDDAVGGRILSARTRDNERSR
jgi:hypothetical protein